VYGYTVRRRRHRGGYTTGRRRNKGGKREPGTLRANSATRPHLHRRVAAAKLQHAIRRRPAGPHARPFASSTQASFRNQSG